MNLTPVFVPALIGKVRVRFDRQFVWVLFGVSHLVSITAARGAGIMWPRGTCGSVHARDEGRCHDERLRGRLFRGAIRRAMQQVYSCQISFGGLHIYISSSEACLRN